MRLLLSTALVVFITSVQNVCADEHWWGVARGTDFKIYDKCVNADTPRTKRSEDRLAR